jgi:hypothetical protein
MIDTERQRGAWLLLRLGAVAAIVGTVLQVAAGSSQSALIGVSADSVLPALAAQPEWLWPTIYLGFMFGALLWVSALVALAASATEGVAWALGRLAVATAIVGATLHIVDGSLNAVGLTGLARSWTVAEEGDRIAMMLNGELLLQLLDGTWAGVITFYHGLPFVLAGLAVALSHRFPAWLGWVGVLGGGGSLVIGVAKLLGVQTGLEVPFAVTLSFFMVVLGWLMWSQADRDRSTSDVPQPAAEATASS